MSILLFKLALILLLPLLGTRFLDASVIVFLLTINLPRSETLAWLRVMSCHVVSEGGRVGPIESASMFE